MLGAVSSQARISNNQKKYLAPDIPENSFSDFTDFPLVEILAWEETDHGFLNQGLLCVVLLILFPFLDHAFLNNGLLCVL